MIDEFSEADNARGGGGPQHPRAEPVFNIPGPVLLAIALLALIYAVQSLLPVETSEWLTINLGFAPVRYIYPPGEQGLEYFWSPVSYSLLHGGLEHLLFNSLWLAAFGTPVARRIGRVRFLLFWIISAAAGAALHAVVNWGSPTLMIGASAVVSALMGSACRFAFGARSRYLPPEIAPRLTVLQALRERTVVVFTAMWLFGNLVIALGLPLFGNLDAEVAWDAHIGGFLFGFLLFGLFDPPQSYDYRVAREL